MIVCNTGYPGSVHTNQDIFKTACTGGSRERVQGVTCGFLIQLDKIFCIV